MFFKNSRDYRWHRAAVLCLAVGMAAGCERGVPEPEAPRHWIRSAGVIHIPEESALRDRLTFVEVGEATISEERSYPGMIEPIPGRFVRIFPPAAGRVAEVEVQLGQTVSPGQPLFSLHSPEFVEAKGEFLKARSATFVAQRNLDRRRVLLEGRVAASRDIEEAESELEMAKADLAAARERLILLGGDPEDMVPGGLLVVHSPIAGRIIELRASFGELYREDEEDPLAMVADLRKVWLAISVPERDAGFLAPGAEVQARLPAFPGRSYSGQVAIVGDIIEPETRTVRVRVELENPDLSLKPGMFGSVRVSGAPAVRLTVPEAAVVYSGGESFVFEQIEEHQLRPRRVQVGESQDGHTIILSGIDRGAVVLARDGVLFQ